MSTEKTHITRQASRCILGMNLSILEDIDPIRTIVQVPMSLFPPTLKIVTISGPRLDST